MIIKFNFSPRANNVISNATLALTILISLWIPKTIHGQTMVNKVWETTEGTPSLLEWSETTSDLNGDLLTTGNTIFSETNVAILTTKHSSSGELIWENKFTHPQGDAISFGIAITTDTAGNVYVAGATRVNGIQSHLVVLKYESDGDLAWYYLSTYSGNDAATDIEVDASGNIFVTGVREGTSTGLDFLTLRLSGSSIFPGRKPTTMLN